ncbi:hypothetical protein [Methylomicrobium sp. Wu6]|uniref:hypothetical protein n=1 Tax=Methylomicrobium sp. Wu6 TaxID=3107928 RepID=UPI002DD6200F|nr:hypothetical protein [Methylomicrobium sp. Wu6]MEC4746895.1 hypothetical protein [Methylomicrobium sp. Wu6]
MFIQGFKCLDFSSIFVVCIAVCVLSAAAYGQDEAVDEAQPADSTSQQTPLPAVEQALVPEGVFAQQLAEALNLGAAMDAAKAEALLSDMGIEPGNGWITEYPVTPAILGNIEKSISAASEQRKITFKKDQALKIFADVKNQLGLGITPGSKSPAVTNMKPGNTTIYSYTDNQGVSHYTDVYDSIPKEYLNSVKTISHPSTSGTSTSPSVAQPSPQSTAVPEPEDLEDYYYQQGPPIITYYYPPQPYYYLYSWVPYPFWYTGYYFTGFYILKDFHRRVYFNRLPFFVSAHRHEDAFHAPPHRGMVTYPFNAAPHPHGANFFHGFSTARAQAGAILTLNQPPRFGLGRTVSPGGEKSQDELPLPRRNASGSMRHSVTLPWNSHGSVLNGNASAPFAESRVNRPSFHPRTYVPERFYAAPGYRQQPFDSPHLSFGRGWSGGFHQRGGMGGFHEGSFGGHGGGGHR